MAVGVCPDGKSLGHHVTPAPFHPTEDHPEVAGRGCSCQRICAGTSRMSDGLQPRYRIRAGMRLTILKDG